MRYKTISKEIMCEKFNQLPLNLTYEQIKQALDIRPFLTEATICAPVHPTDIQSFMELFNKDMPAGISVFLISDLLNDDGLNSELNSFATRDPYADARPVIVQWVSNNMPHIVPTGKFDNDNGAQSIVGSHLFK